MFFGYFVGVALVGAGIGALSVHMIWSRLGSDPHAFVVILAAVAGAAAAMALQRYVIIIATAFAGGWTMLWGAMNVIDSSGYARAAAASVDGVSARSLARPPLGPRRVGGDRPARRVRSASLHRAIGGAGARQSAESKDVVSTVTFITRSVRLQADHMEAHMATFERSVTTDWEGGLMDGKGMAKAGSGAFSLPVTFPNRIGEPRARRARRS